MSSSKLRNQGELLIDHTNSPGVTPEWVEANRHHLIASGATTVIVGKGQKFEAGLKNCSHCGTDVIMRPERERAREWCWVCDAYICDGCGLLRKLSGYEHKTARQIMDNIFNRYQRSF